MIKPYLSDLINKHKIHGSARYHSVNKSWIGKTSSESKIQLTMVINFVSSKDSDETRTMHTRINNAEIMVGSETNEIIKDLFESFLQKKKVSLSRGRSYIDSPKRVKNKRATINPQNKKDGRCLQYAVTVALNHEQIKDHPERISKVKPFIDKYY